MGFPAWVICSLNSCHGSDEWPPQQTWQTFKQTKSLRYLEICQLASNLPEKEHPAPVTMFFFPNQGVSSLSLEVSSMVFRNKTPKSCNKSCGPSILSSLPLADPTTWKLGWNVKKNPVWFCYLPWSRFSVDPYNLLTISDPGTLYDLRKVWKNHAGSPQINHLSRVRSGFFVDRFFSMFESCNMDTGHYWTLGQGTK